MPTILTDDGVTLSYRVQGHGPTTLLFMHGWAGSGVYFDEVVGDLDLNALQVITGQGKGLSHPDMGRGLMLGFLSFTLLTVIFVWARARQHLAEARLDETEEEAIEHGLIED